MAAISYTSNVEGVKQLRAASWAVVRTMQCNMRGEWVLVLGRYLIYRSSRMFLLPENAHGSESVGRRQPTQTRFL
jgi:hypothetical protein